jgi:hypothetical protein
MILSSIINLKKLIIILYIDNIHYMGESLNEIKKLVLERGRSRDCQEDYISPTLVMRAGANSH